MTDLTKDEATNIADIENALFAKRDSQDTNSKVTFQVGALKVTTLKHSQGELSVTDLAKFVLENVNDFAPKDANSLSGWVMYSDQINCFYSNSDNTQVAPEDKYDGILKRQGFILEAEFTYGNGNSAHVRRIQGNQLLITVFTLGEVEAHMVYQDQDVCVRQDLLHTNGATANNGIPAKCTYRLWYKNDAGRMVPYVQQFIGFVTKKGE